MKYVKSNVFVLYHSPCVTIMMTVRRQPSSCATCVATSAPTATASSTSTDGRALIRDRSVLNAILTILPIAFTSTTFDVSSEKSIVDWHVLVCCLTAAVRCSKKKRKPSRSTSTKAVGGRSSSGSWLWQTLKQWKPWLSSESTQVIKVFG